MRPFLAFLWLAALLLRPAAQDDGLTLSARAGFDGLFKETAAVPVIVSARNDGPPIEGEIRVTVDDSRGGEVVYTAPISLPTGSDKRVALYVHVLPFAGDLSVQLVSDDAVVAAIETNALNMVARDDLLYGVVTSDPGGLAFLGTISGGRSAADVAYLDLADLPDVSIAWRALDVLVLDDVDTSRLTAGQLAALRAWAEDGGQLVVTGGPGGPKTTAAVADLLPVTVGGVESADDLPALSAFGGAAFTTPGPYTLTGSSLRTGELLVHQDALPILVHTALGLGGVTFLALDPKLAPLAGWSGHTAVWESILAQTPARGPLGNGIQEGYGAVQAISSIPGLRLPSVWQLLLFLFAYTLIIGPINFLVLRRLRRRELAWVTIPVLVLLFSAITFFTGFRSRGGAAVLNEMSVAYGSVEAERVRTQSIVGLYSPRRGRYDLSLPYDDRFPLHRGVRPGDRQRRGQPGGHHPRRRPGPARRAGRHGRGRGLARRRPPAAPAPLGHSPAGGRRPRRGHHRPQRRPDNSGKRRRGLWRSTTATGRPAAGRGARGAIDPKPTGRAGGRADARPACARGRHPAPPAHQRSHLHPGHARLLQRRPGLSALATVAIALQLLRDGHAGSRSHPVHHPGRLAAR